MTRQRTPSAELEICIEACWTCHRVCWRTAMAHCLQMGGEHVEPVHFRLMLNCAELCQTAANFMLSESIHASGICALCADVCESCAESCEQVGQMADCVQACRQCVQQCRHMSGGAIQMN